MQRDILQGGQRMAEFQIATPAGHSFSGHSADRSILRGLMGADTLIGVSAEDGVTADHRDDVAGVTVRLDEGWAEDGWGHRDTLVNIRSAAGSLMDDLIVAHAGGSWMAGYAGDDTLQGGAGFDTVSYRGTTAAVSVNLATGEAQDGEGGIDSLSGIEFVAGSSHADALTGDDRANWFFGNRGADTVDGAGGENSVSYYAPWKGLVDPAVVQGVLVDLRAGFARDGDGSPDGGSRDVLLNIEHAVGSHLGDTLVGTDGANQLWGAEGNDRLEGRLGADTYLVGAGDKLVEGAGGGTDMVLAGFTYTLGANLETLTLTGTGGSGGTGNTGANLIAGNTGANALRGGDGADTLHGGGGADTLFGEGGSDVLRGDAGADVFRFDRASHSNRWGTDTILDFEAGVDRIAFENNAGVLFAGLTPGAFALGTAQALASAGSVAAIYTQISAVAASTATLQAKLVTVAAGTAAGTYLYVNDGQAAVSQTTDMLIRLDLAGGTLAASDVVFF